MLINLEVNEKVGFKYKELWDFEDIAHFYQLLPGFWTLWQIYKIVILGVRDNQGA